MGSEHSSFSNNPQRQGSLNTDSQGKQMGAIKRQHTIANPGSSQDNLEENGENFRSISPGPSVCSDVDLPYISYTVNRPIGGNTYIVVVILLTVSCRFPQDADKQTVNKG